MAYVLTLKLNGETRETIRRTKKTVASVDLWKLCYRALESDGALATNRAWDLMHDTNAWNGEPVTFLIRNGWSVSVERE